MNTKQKMQLLELLLCEQSENENESKPAPLVGEMVVLRCRNAGVHYGRLEARGRDWVELRNARRIWIWDGAFTLSELAAQGVTGGRIACVVPRLSVPVCDVGEILGLSIEAQATLDNISE